MLSKKTRDFEKEIEKNLKLGLGHLAVYYLEKLENPLPQVTKCLICGCEIKKWARACPRCRNSL